MFSEQLNTIMAALELSPPALAAAMGCDRSNIDRMCKGSRVPRRNGASVRRLVNALYACAGSAGRTDVLRQTVSCKEDLSESDVCDALANWLFAGEAAEASKKETQEKQQSYRAFGQKLNAVMALTGLTNVRLGKLLHVDGSYISRFRNGLRSPTGNPDLADRLCEVLLEISAAKGVLPQLASLMQTPQDALCPERAALPVFRGWLFDLAPEDPAPLVADMLDQIGSIRAPKGLPLPFEEAAPAQILAETAAVYYGQAGLRRAVLRFLGGVVLQRPKKLLLYSDQNMDWMVADPFFRAQWSTLMALVVAGGTRIGIIHNIDRDLTEMAAAIRSWLPLYPSGMIRSYYSRIPNRGRFSTTIFLCPGIASISGANVRGTEDAAGIYRYDTDPAVLAAQEETYRAMRENAGELVHTQPAADAGRFGEAETPHLTVLSHTLSLATMPEETLLSALGRAGADEATRSRLLLLHRERAAVLTRAAKHGSLQELIPLPAPEALQNGGVPMDLPGLSLYYTPEDFSSHIKNVLALTEQFANYRFFPLPAPVFPEMQVLISDAAASVVRLQPPALAMRFSHPELCRAFVSFAGGLLTQYRQDRLAVKKALEAYL